MTQHWWMHWFWVTVWAVMGLLAGQCWCAPQGTYQPAHHLVSTDPSQYMALLSDLEHPPPVDYGGYEEEDTYGAGGGNLFPLPHAIPRKIIIEHSFSAPPHETTFIPIHTSHEPTHEEVMMADEDHTKETFATRLAKAIATTSVPGMPVQYKNRNPFINEEMEVNKSPAATILVAEISTPEATASDTTTEAPVEEKVDLETEPSEETLVAAPSSPPPHHEPIPEEHETNESTPSSEGHKQTEATEAVPEAPLPTKELDVMSGGIHPIPPWIPDAKQEDADSEEEEREMEQIDRITNALVEEETAEEGEAITRGRMTPNKGLGTASIVGIALGFVGIICMAGAAAGFLLYKRSLLNKPQTLNDKISNPDYSSYIDDTLRDNSEEMYSLDNDSFLNSLEAMTIQNYWTENVKHTKL